MAQIEYQFPLILTATDHQEYITYLFHRNFLNDQQKRDQIQLSLTRDIAKDQTETRNFAERMKEKKRKG